MTFEEWKQKNYKMWNTEQAYMLACEGTPEEENAVDKYSKMIFEAAQPKWTMCRDAMPDKDGTYLWLDDDRTIHFDHFFANMPLIEHVIAWMSLPEYKEQTE